MIISHTTKKYIEEQIIFYQANVNEYKQIRDAILFESRASAFRWKNKMIIDVAKEFGY